MNVFGADKMEAIIIVINAAVDVNSSEPDVFALHDAHGMIGGGEQENIPNAKVRALVEKQMIWSLEAGEAGG